MGFRVHAMYGSGFTLLGFGFFVFWVLGAGKGPRIRGLAFKAPVALLFHNQCRSTDRASQCILHWLIAAGQAAGRSGSSALM